LAFSLALRLLAPIVVLGLTVFITRGSYLGRIGYWGDRDMWAISAG
jgi:hypothetical protein